jgi:hypothetical protein
MIDEKRRLLDLLLFAEFTQEQQCPFRGSGRKQPNVEKFVRLRINRSVQPVPILIKLNHGFVDGDVIRLSIGGWL